MKIVITGSLGHISRPLTEGLVKEGNIVTVISSKAERQKEIGVLGAIAAIGSVEDTGFLESVFIGADIVYTMVPPLDFFKPGPDQLGYYRKVAKNYAKAIEDAGIKRVIHLSSIGAHLSRNSGLILGHHSAEEILDGLQNVSLTFMRPTAFYYNLFGFLNLIKNTGRIASNYGGSDKVPWVSPSDIAAAIVEEMEAPHSKRIIRYVASDEPTCNEIATALGRAIGLPHLKWELITNEQMQTNCEAAGMQKGIAAGFVKMNASMHTGELLEDYRLNRPRVLGNTKLAEFTKEFAAAFRQL